MKKHSYLVFIVLLLVAFIPFNVMAVDCSSRSLDSCKGDGESNHYCAVVNGKCAIAPCGAVPLDRCNYVSDADGNKCAISNDAKRCETVNESGNGGNGGTGYRDDVDDPKNPDDYDNYNPDEVTCGGGLTFNSGIANVTYYFVLMFQIFAPVALIIWGMIDLFKGVIAGKDDDIKKGQAAFFKRLSIAVVMFLIVTIVRIVLSVFSANTILDCFNCFVNGASKCRK